MDNFLLIEFIPACLLMGLAIGIDAAIATSINATSIKSWRQQLVWVLAISATHTLFPMLGYWLSYAGSQYFPLLSPFIGLTAFALIAHFLWQELYPVDNDSHTDQRGTLISVGLILAVSWDALWSGPAKSAQVIHWPEFAIWGSFILVGLTVTVLICASLILSRTLRQHYLKAHTRHFLIAQWLQYSAISYFGWLALFRYTFGWFIPWPFLLLFSLVFMALILHRALLASRKAQPAY